MAKMIGPFEVSIFVHVVEETEDGRRFGKVEVSLAKGVVPTLESIHNAIGQAIEGIPESFRLLDGDEFLQQLVAEKYGRRVRLAAGESWHYDVEALKVAALAERENRKKSEPKKERESDDEPDFDEDDFDFDFD